MAEIIRLEDLYAQKSKDEELNRYWRELVKLQDKLYKIRKEIALTEQIIKMVEKEQIVEFKKNEKQKSEASKRAQSEERTAPN